jgi:hypothetical protein
VHPMMDSALAAAAEAAPTMRGGMTLAEAIM